MPHGTEKKVKYFAPGLLHILPKLSSGKTKVQRCTTFQYSSSGCSFCWPTISLPPSLEYVGHRYLRLDLAVKIITEIKNWNRQIPRGRIMPSLRDWQRQQMSRCCQLKVGMGTDGTDWSYHEEQISLYASVGILPFNPPSKKNYRDALVKNTFSRRMAQWSEHTLPTNVPSVWIPGKKLVLVLSLLQGVFPRGIQQFLSFLKKQHLQFSIRSWLGSTWKPPVASKQNSEILISSDAWNSILLLVLMNQAWPSV